MCVTSLFQIHKTYLACRHVNIVNQYVDRLYIFWVGEKPCNLANKNKLVESCRFLIVKETAQKTVNLKEQRNPADW